MLGKHSAFHYLRSPRRRQNTARIYMQYKTRQGKLNSRIVRLRDLRGNFNAGFFFLFFSCLFYLYVHNMCVSSFFLIPFTCEQWRHRSPERGVHIDSPLLKRKDRRAFVVQVVVSYICLRVLMHSHTCSSR